MSLFLLQRELQSSGVTFQFDECDDEHATNRHHLQPLLGYDWIAGTPYRSISLSHIIIKWTANR